MQLFSRFIHMLLILWHRANLWSYVYIFFTHFILNFLIFHFNLERPSTGIYSYKFMWILLEAISVDAEWGDGKMLQKIGVFITW